MKNYTTLLSVIFSVSKSSFLFPMPYLFILVFVGMSSVLCLLRTKIYACFEYNTTDFLERVWDFLPEIKKRDFLSCFEEFLREQRGLLPKKLLETGRKRPFFSPERKSQTSYYTAPQQVLCKSLIRFRWFRKFRRVQTKPSQPF